MPTLEDIQGRLALDDFSGALSLARERLARVPDCEETREVEKRCETTLCDMHLAALGGEQVGVQRLKSMAELQWLTLDPLAAFVVSRVDDGIRLEELLDVVDRPRLETLRLLTKLRDQGVIELVLDARKRSEA